MNSSPCIITGGTSFIGKHLVRRLLEKNRPITLLVRDSLKVPEDWQGRVEIVEGDIREKDCLSRLPLEGSIIFHLAGEIKRKPLFFDVNVGGTKNLIDLAVSAGTKHLVYLSSVGVFGYPGNNLIDENVPCSPVSEYEKSKYEAESILAEYHEKYLVPITILRPSIVFGEGSKSESFLGWMRSIKNRTFRFIGNRSYANYIYVGDMVEAFLRVSQTGRAGKEIFILSDGKSMLEFVRCAAENLRVEIPKTSIPRWFALMVAGAFAPLANYFGKSFPLTISRVKALTDQRVFSMEKIRKELGFQPQYGIVNGLKRTLRWYEEKGLL